MVCSIMANYFAALLARRSSVSFRMFDDDDDDDVDDDDDDDDSGGGGDGDGDTDHV